MTYFGSGIWSYTRFSAGAILSVRVPATTSRSACRGPCANGMTPNRMKSCLEVEAAMNSIAPQADARRFMLPAQLRPVVDGDPGVTPVPGAHSALAEGAVGGRQAAHQGSL